MSSRDIDMEIYCPSPRVEMGFSVVGALAQRKDVWKVRFSNELDAPDRGLYWQVVYRPSTDEVWTIDMWLLPDDHPGPRAVDLVQPMRAVLTDQTSRAILAVKGGMQGREGVHAIDIYRAVLDNGIRSPEEFSSWLSRQPSGGLTLWVPRINHG
jgi:hypothetical protein